MNEKENISFFLTKRKMALLLMYKYNNFLSDCNKNELNNINSALLFLQNNISYKLIKNKLLINNLKLVCKIY